MKPRPTSVTVIAWILIVVGCLALITTTFSLSLSNPQVRDLMARSPIPIPVQYVISYAGLAVMIASGVGMLKGQNWARLLYVIWTAVSILLGLATAPVRVMLIPGVILYGVIVFFLFRPKANQYFTESEAPPAAESH
jgi:hypothetical protein